MSGEAEVDRPELARSRAGETHRRRHVAIIMDGNGRWAASAGCRGFEGHRRGVEAIRRTVRAAGDLGIRYLTVYSFSSENWRRPGRGGLGPDGPSQALHPQRPRRPATHQRPRPDHRRAGATSSAEIRALLVEAEDLTAANTGLTLVVAFNYGGRQEIAAGRPAPRRGRCAGRLEPDDIERGGIWLPGSTRPAFPIRTSSSAPRASSAFRTSCFWQAAYAEFVFTPVLWPDFDKAALEAALAEYRSRERRFGGLSTRAGAVSS